VGPSVDFVEVPAVPTAATPWQTCLLPGSYAGSNPPSEGDEYLFTDTPAAALGAGTTLVVEGKVGSLGKQIRDGGALANSITLNAAGAWRRLVFSSKYDPGGAWLVVARSAA
jgi:hypothetical protein